MESSACDGVRRPKGIGFVPPAGARSCLFQLPNGQGISACFLMDLSADPFVGGLTNSDLLRRAELRYGPNFHGIDAERPRFLGLDFESLFGIGSVQLQQKCCENELGTRNSRSCVPTLTELHDWYAINSTSIIPIPIPGQPRITEATSPAPGVVTVTWVTRAHDSFEVQAGSVKKTVPGTVFSTRVDLPQSEGGEIPVTVTAFASSRAGRPSIPKIVVVRPRDLPTNCLPFLPCKLPATLATGLAGLGEWNAVNAERKNSLTQLEIWVLWFDAKPPAEVARTIRDAKTWNNVAGGRRQRLQGVATWLQSFR
jgi:hypothetical protein